MMLRAVTASSAPTNILSTAIDNVIRIDLVVLPKTPAAAAAQCLAAGEMRIDSRDRSATDLRVILDAPVELGQTTRDKTGA